MSTPRTLQTVGEILDAARAHGFLIRPDGGGHHRILQRREGEVARTVTTCPATSINYHNLKNVVARIKKETGVDIRQPVPPRLVAPEREVVIEVKTAGLHDTPTESQLRRVVQEEIQTLLERFARAIMPEPIRIPTAPPGDADNAALAPADPLWKTLGRSKPRRKNLTDQEKTEIVAMYEAGELLGEIERAYDLGKNGANSILRKLGVPPMRRAGRTA